MAKEAVFVVTLSPAPTTSVTVNYTTRDGTATAAGGDYTPTSGTLTFAVGETSKEVVVPIQLASTGEASEQFYLDVTWPSGSSNTVADGTGVCTIPGSTTVVESYLDRFTWTYNTLKADSTGFFGPPTGTKAKTVPYHSLENLIVEAPDWGHQSVSETVSFWAKLEAWKFILSGSMTGYQAMWNSVEANFIPSAANQPVGTFTPASPATFLPNQNNPNLYPVMPDISMTVGADPLYAPLYATYGTKSMYLMHWIWDTDGVYGFKNGDGTTTQVAINSFQRGLQESSWETITQPEWEDWTNGGGTYGYLPLFGKSKPTYSTAPFEYAKQWRYTCAPDAEVRLIESAYQAHKVDTGAVLTSFDGKAKKMGDYLRYALYDKYFKPIGGSSGTVTDASGCHYLVSWYVSWGGEIPATGMTSSWGFRIGSSESHFGYNGVMAAYAMATSGGAYSPTTTGAASMWETSLARQLEFIRWLQTPEGAIAGGVSNSWYDQYVVPTDGRQTTTFYGMYYTYSPVWHDPPSNKWAGFQYWGVERVAALYLEVADKTGTFNTDIRTKCGVILDRFVAWVLAHSSLTTSAFTIPGELSWTSPTAVAGQTTTAPNLEGVYEYLPTLTWPGSSPNYATFWSGSAVPNPNLKCTITATSDGLGEGAALAQLLIQYAKAKVNAGGVLTDYIPGSSTYTVEAALILAKGILDRIWNNSKDTKGFTHDEVRADYNRYDDPVFVPSGFTGTMPNGDVINSSSTFISIRTFMRSDPDWTKIQAYLDGGSAPTFRYHRFWHITEIACAFAMMHKHFPSQVPG